VLTCPESVAGKRILDLGCGSGLVGIAAMAAGASSAVAVDTNPHAVVAARLNARANGVAVEVIQADLLDGPPPKTDLILAGDVFYSRTLAHRMSPFLRRCRDAGVEVLIGDPGRAPLPRSRLRRVAAYAVADFGSGGRETPAAVYDLVPDQVKRGAVDER
jgi:predicted nicotinamide N-methyase